MHHSTTRVLTGLCAVALGAGMLGAAAPAHANEAPPPTSDRIVSISAAVPAYSSPRLNTAVATELHAGDRVPAFCGFTNAGLEWVKVFAGDTFGYVQSASVAGGVGTLPRDCPSEIEAITMPAPGKSFEFAAWGVPLDGFTCPASYPYLDTRVKFEWFDLVDSVGNEYIPGVRADRPAEIGIDLGPALAADGDAAERGERISGYTGATISNLMPWPASAKLTATCTSNPAFAAEQPF